MLNNKFIQQLKKDFQANNEQRRMIISQSNIILHQAKRIIFATHRQDLKTAQASLQEITKELIKLQKNFGYQRLAEEGAYQAAMEEFVEAWLFLALTSGQKIDKIKNLEISAISYLGGLCDLTGELVRQAINAASQNNNQLARTNYQLINDIIKELVEFDMTGYLRTKYDQAQNNLRKIEQINYDLAVKR